MKGFLDFVREQGVVGLAIGFILGGAVSQVVTSIVNDIVNPLMGLFLGSTKSLEKMSFSMGTAKILYGHFLSILINFIVIAAVVYAIVKLLKLDLKKKK